MGNGLELAERAIAFYVKHAGCSDRKVRSELNLKLRRQHPDVFNAMVALQNAPSECGAVADMKRTALSAAFVKAFARMDTNEKREKPLSATG